MSRGQLPTKQLSASNWGAFDHASHEPQLLADNYYLQRLSIDNLMCVASSPGHFCVSMLQTQHGSGLGMRLEVCIRCSYMCVQWKNVYINYIRFGIIERASTDSNSSVCQQLYYRIVAQSPGISDLFNARCNIEKDLHAWGTSYDTHGMYVHMYNCVQHDHKPVTTTLSCMVG